MNSMGGTQSAAAAKEKVVYEHNKPHQGFLQHTRREHDVWNYVFFIFHINTKDPTTYTGPEQTIRDMLANEDIGWFPIEKATLLERADMAVDVDGVHGAGAEHGHSTGDGGNMGGSLAGLEALLSEMKHDLSQMKEGGGGRGARGGA